MRSIKSLSCRKHRGAALIISMIFVLVFSALAVSMAAMSGTNLQIARNQHKINCALACAESGFQIVRYWLNRVSISGSTAPAQTFTQIANSLQNELTANEISNIDPNYESSIITIPGVTLDSANGQSFYAKIRPLPPLDEPNTLQVDITGAYGSISRTIRVNYEFGTRAHTVFDYGLATKGPLHLAGNTELDGINIAGESDIYIESDAADDTLSIIGNSQIAGNVSFTSSDPDIELGPQASIGEETGQDAIDNHVFTSVPPTEFPAPNPGYFEHYVVEDINYPSTETTFENIRIPAGTNPSFAGGVTLRGIIFIETPNIVTFTGNLTITGIIVGNGDIEDNSAANQIIFQGDIDSHPVDQLPSGPQFDPIKNETGTFLIAPGFKTSFGGSFETINGAIAANGIKFYGNAGGTIDGSIINYSDEEMTLTGSSDLYFNRSGTDQIPAGFVPEIILEYNPTSYSEIVL